MINSAESEQSVLGCILIDSDTIHELSLDKDDFYEKENSLIFSSIKELIKEWTPIDLITVKEKLENNKQLKQIGGITYLMELTEIVPTTSNFSSYQKSVKDLSTLRKVNRLSWLILDWIGKWDNADDIIADVYNSLTNIEEGIWSNAKDIADILEDTLDYIEQIKSTDLVGLTFWTQFKWLDMMTGWIQPWYIYRIGWGSNIGKSWLMYNVLISVLQKDDRVTFFALENEDRFTMKNLLWLKKWVNSLPEKIKRENYDFTEELMWFNEKGNFKIDSTHKNLHEIFRSAIKNKSKYIFIDYIQAVDIPWKFAGDVQKYAYYSLELQKFATKYGIAVIDLSQLSNDSQKWGVNGLGSGEFKWGGSLKESCDVWLHIFADTNACAAKESALSSGDNDTFYKNYVQVKLTKNRLGWGVNSYKNYILDFDEWGKYLYNDI